MLITAILEKLNLTVYDCGDLQKLHPLPIRGLLQITKQATPTVPHYSPVRLLPHNSPDKRRRGVRTGRSHPHHGYVDDGLN